MVRPSRLSGVSFCTKVHLQLICILAYLPRGAVIRSHDHWAELWIVSMVKSAPCSLTIPTPSAPVALGLASFPLALSMLLLLLSSSTPLVCWLVLSGLPLTLLFSSLLTTSSSLPLSSALLTTTSSSLSSLVLFPSSSSLPSIPLLADGIDA